MAFGAILSLIFKRNSLLIVTVWQLLVAENDKSMSA
jgi:hypothetical protein